MSRIPLTLFMISMSSAFALPSGGAVQSGSADFYKSNDSLKIQVSDQTILDWNSFSIGATESVHFALPDSNATVLNRVVGSERSDIFGSLISNGQVILINPQGILFGKESRIDVGGLFASTFDIHENVFCSFGAKAQIVHLGSISSQNGDVIFAGSSIECHGKIETQGKTVTLMAVSCSNDPGLIQINGTISSPGGKIQVYGSSLIFSSEVLFDVSSYHQGGKIEAGRGANVFGWQFPPANFVEVVPGAVLKADALEIGNGGTIDLWGEKANQMHGSLSAMGGPLGGDGGLIEISSPLNLHVSGTASTFAPVGKIGTLLFDPNNITISTGATNPMPPPGIFYDGAGVANAVLNNTNLAAALMVNNVVVQTNGATAGGNGDIFVTAPVVWTAPTSLTLSAARDITVSANIQQSALTACPGQTALVILNAGRNVSISGASAQTAVGSQNDGTIVTAAGNITVQAGAIADRSAQIGYYTPPGGASTGPIQVNAGGNISILAGSGNRTGAVIGHGEFNVSQAAAVSVATTSTASINVVAGGNVTLTGGTGLSSQAAIGHGAHSLGAGAGSNQGGDITVSAGGNLTLSVQGTRAHANIGHGSGAGLPGAIPLFSGNIGVFTGGDLILNRGPATAGGVNVHIGHYQEINAPAGAVTDIEGDIEIGVGRDFILNDFVNTNGDIIVGHFATNLTNLGLVTPVVERIVVGRDFLINKTTAANRIIVGYFQAAPTTVSRMSLLLEVNGNLTLASTSASAGGLTAITSIGALGTIGPLFGVIGGNATIQANEAFFFESFNADMNFAVQGNFSISGLPTPPARIATLSTNGGGLRFFVGGSITLTQSANLSTSFFLDPALFIDIRAANNINQLTNSMTVTAGQILSVQAAHPFVSGELYTSSGTFPYFYNTICGQPTGVQMAQFSTSCTHFPCACVCTPCPCNNTSSNFGSAVFQCGNSGANCNDLMCLYSNGIMASSPPISTSCGILSFEPTISLSGPPSSLILTGGCSTSCGGVAQTVSFGVLAGGNDVFINGSPGSVDIGPVDNLIFNQALTTTGSIRLRACNNLTINSPMTSTGAGSPITLIADFDDSGAGDLSLNASVTTNNGNILLDAGLGSSLLASSSINQTVGTISSGTGSITAQAASNITINGAATSVTSTSGAISMQAGNNINILRNLLSTSGPISLIADSDDTGAGNLSLAANVITNNNILLDAGFDALLGTSSILQTAGVISSSTGSIRAQALRDITINGAATGILATAGSISMEAGNNISLLKNVASTSGSISTLAGNDTFLTNASVTTSNSIQMITGDSMFLSAGIISSSGSFIDLVVDNNFPSPPLTGPGIFSMDANSSISAPVYIRIYTAMQQNGAANNQISPNALFNGVPISLAALPYPGTIFTDTIQEQWCIYFPNGSLGSPFRIFYKNCLQQALEQAMIIIDELNFFIDEDTFPYYGIDEYYGWPSRFIIFYDLGMNPTFESYQDMPPEKYFLLFKNWKLISRGWKPNSEKPRSGP